MKASIFLFKVFSIITLFTFFNSCKKDDTYELKTVIYPEGAGWVTPSSGIYKEWDQVTLTATPYAYYRFKNYSGSVSSTESTVSVTMETNKLIYVNFESTDNDKDGCPNVFDECPNTPSGLTVNQNGCAETEVDTDNDGVPDYLDNCPNTNPYSTADANGCSLSQYDEDDDGVPDYLDACPNTPLDEHAGTSGCSSSQTDTDGDGVMNNVDLCPNTPSGHTVDSSGCNFPTPVYLDSNGVTIKCYDWAEVGQSGSVNGIEYIIVDDPLLRDIVRGIPHANTYYSHTFFLDERISNVCTSKITNMDGLFEYQKYVWEPDNIIDISMWDVSNVTSMNRMFFNSQNCTHSSCDYSYWDVSNVESMKSMFYSDRYANSDTVVNSSISSWDVSNVTNMSGMLGGVNHFNNKDLSAWNVSNVINCTGFANYDYWTLPRPNFTNCTP